MSNQTASRKETPGAVPASSHTGEIHQVMLGKSVLGALSGAILGALLGALFGAFLAWLLGGAGWLVADRALGGENASLGGEIGSLLGAIIATIGAQQSLRPLRDTLLWFCIALLVLLLFRTVGALVLGWEIGGTPFSWATCGVIVGTLCGSRGLAAHYGGAAHYADAPKVAIGSNREVPADAFSLDWMEVLVRKLFPNARAAAVGAALAGAIGGAAGGWFYGVFTGEQGKALIGGTVGALIGTAVLGAIGGGIGTFLAIREHERSGHREKV